MKKKYFLSLVAMFLLLLTSCSLDSIEASSDITVEERVVPSFSAIKASNDIEVVITKGNEQKVDVTTSRNVQERVTTNVIDGVLYIELNKLVRKLKELRVDITIPEISKITLTSDAFGHVSGFENIQALDVNMSSDAHLLLSGSSNSLNINANSDASIDAFGFEALNCTVNCSSDASASITCLNALNGSISSDASVFYKGNPTIDVQTSTDGTLINAN